MHQMYEISQEEMYGNDVEGLLQFLQHADSQFPSGSFAFSAGLETLFSDQRINSIQEVASFVEGQLRFRWASFDRAALVKTYRCGNDSQKIADVDHVVELMNLAEGLREGSKKNGRALLSMHARLKTPLVEDYRSMISAEKAFGHIPVVQGMLWRQIGLTELRAQAASAHGVCSDLLGAAMRLGKIGHIHAQQIRTSMNIVISEILSERIDSEPVMHAYVPAAEIAVMRHETSELRLFAN